MFFPSTIKEWFSNITMIYFDIVPHRIKPRVVPTTWALTNEIFFYILISFGISKTKKLTFIWLFVSILYYIFTYIFYDLATFRYSAIPASSLPFAIGATLFWLNETLSKIKTGIISIFLLFALFNLNAIYLANSSIYFFREFSIYINHVIAALLILSLFTIKSGKTIKQIDTYIGHYSYPIYLSHYLVCAIFIHIFDFGHVDGEYKLLIIAIAPFFLILLAFCFVIVHGIDVKINSFKTILKSKKKKSMENSLPQNILND
jgi:peptidoglycan/LPS O-acetylase OafA/YrhL